MWHRKEEKVWSMSELQRVDCGKCQFCLDKGKFGGPERLKKCCIPRQSKLATYRVSSNSGNSQGTKLKSRTALSSIEDKIDNLSKLCMYLINTV